jgi:hypothetical protein
MLTEQLRRIERGSSATTLDKILTILVPETQTVLDMTWGYGNFWTPAMLARWRVTGYDLDPALAKDKVGDFTALKDADGAYDVAIFDPPYQTDPGAAAVIDAQFGSYPTIADLRHAVTLGTREAVRVARVGIVVKVMDYIHASRLVRMSRWVEEAAGLDLYDFVMVESPSKIEDGRWTKHGAQLSVRSTATTWLVFRKDGPVHRRRRTPKTD